jgi:hypothetical protein
LPLYPRVSVVRGMLPEHARRRGIRRVGLRVPVVFGARARRSSYPHARPVLAPGIRARRAPTCSMLVVDSWRRDIRSTSATTPRTSSSFWRTPRGASTDHLQRRQRDALRGVLDAVRAARLVLVARARGAARSPVLLETLDAKPVTSCAGLLGGVAGLPRVPPQRPGHAVARAGARRLRRGLRSAAARPPRRASLRFEQWLARTRQRSQPFFAFVLLDSAHQPYDFPPEDEAPFTPFAQ